MDKAELIRHEIEKRRDHNLAIGNPLFAAMAEEDIELLLFIDSMQEEPKPKFKIGDCIKPIESSLGSPRTICEVCDSWYVTNQGTLDFEFEDNWELVEEPVSEELEKVVEEIVNPTVLNAYGVKEIANRLRRTMIEPVSEEWIKELKTKLDSMSKEDFKKVFDKYAIDFNEEPVSDELEKASKEWLRPQLDKSYAKYGEVKMMELTHFDGYAMLDAIEFGAEWQKTKDESTTENLGEYINELSKQFPEVSFAKLSRIAVRVAKWQKQHLLKPADGDNLPEIDREVIALLDNGKVVFAHRPPEFWDGKNIVTGKVTRNYPKTYDKGGWNIPNVKYWLDCLRPKEIEL